MHEIPYCSVANMEQTFEYVLRILRNPSHTHTHTKGYLLAHGHDVRGCATSFFKEIAVFIWFTSSLKVFHGRDRKSVV